MRCITFKFDEGHFLTNIYVYRRVCGLHFAEFGASASLTEDAAGR